MRFILKTEDRVLVSLTNEEYRILSEEIPNISDGTYVRDACGLLIALRLIHDKEQEKIGEDSTGS